MDKDGIIKTAIGVASIAVGAVELMCKTFRWYEKKHKAKRNDDTNGVSRPYIG